jgi:hypothetical protein
VRLRDKVALITGANDAASDEAACIAGQVIFADGGISVGI